jgi:hypothetical protein
MQSWRPVSFLAALGIIVSSAQVHAQHSPAQADSARVQIQRTLRAFYFNLAHHDWEALTADILAAKVVAHRPAPEGLVIAAEPVACSSPTTAQVEQAAIRLEGDWAQASVPRCITGSPGIDEFRLINFERRWRFVSIDLFDGPINLSADR